MAAERYELEAATRHFTEGIELVERWGEAGAITGYTGLARVRQAQGDEQGALEFAQMAQRLAERFDAMEVDDISVAMCQARLWIAQGNFEAATGWVEERDLAAALTLETLYDEIRTSSSLYRYFEYATLAWLRIAQGRPEEALRVLPALLQAADEGRWVIYGLEALALKALALQALGDVTQALDALEQALSLAEPGGFVHLFVEKGPAMARLLRHAASRGIAPAYVGRLLASFDAPAQERPRETPPYAPAHPLVEPLTERELEVLRLLPSHLSSTEIAENLYISVHTARFHIKNIYGKLNVHSRADAVARARDLGLL
jgi:LuxR family maltose regulon positive regulatory protein